MSQKNDGKKRDSRGRFQSGHSGGPGRKPGEPSKVARALRAQWSERAEQVAQSVLDRALDGDLEAAKIIMQRLYPAPKDNAVHLELPQGASLTELTEAVLQAVAEGQLTPHEGQVVASIVTSHAKAYEVESLKERLTSMERALQLRIDQERENAKSK